jgi:hypothetical protein
MTKSFMAVALTALVATPLGAQAQVLDISYEATVTRSLSIVMPALERAMVEADHSSSTGGNLNVTSAKCWHVGPISGSPFRTTSFNYFNCKAHIQGLGSQVVGVTWQNDKLSFRYTLPQPAQPQPQVIYVIPSEMTIEFY